HTLVRARGYGGTRKPVPSVGERRGARVPTAELPIAGVPPPGIVQAIESALTPATRMLVVDHVVSGSSLILPIADIAARCRTRGVRTLVDGAHAPGIVPLELARLGVDYYTGNLHKWAMAPHSAGIL